MERSKFVGMLAAGNFRYSLTVYEGGCIVTVYGRRTEAPSLVPMEFYFNPDGELTEVR